MANVISTEVAEFRADGVDEIIAKVRQYKAETDSLTESVKAQQSANEKMLKVASGRTMPPLKPPSYAAGGGMGAAAKQMTAELNRGVDAYLKKIPRAMSDALEKTKQMSAAMMRAMPAAATGARSALGSVPGVGGMLAGGGVAATWAKGFAGTVEAGRMDREFELLGREVAGAFKPVTDAFTEAIRSLRMGLEHLNPNQQNAMVAAGVTLASAYALNKAKGEGGMRDTVKNAGIVALAYYALDKADIAFKTARRFYESNEVSGQTGMFGQAFGYSNELKMSREEFDSTGYGRFGQISNLNERNKAIDEEMNKITKLREDLAGTGRVKNIMGMMGSVFGLHLFGDGINARDTTAYDRDLIKSQKALWLMQNNPGGIQDNPFGAHRRVTPDNISYGELGSSYEEATLGLLKVNMGKDNNDYLREIAQYTGKMAENKGSPDESVANHPVANLTR